METKDFLTIGDIKEGIENFPSGDYRQACLSLFNLLFVAQQKNPEISVRYADVDKLESVTITAKGWGEIYKILDKAVS